MFRLHKYSKPLLLLSSTPIISYSIINESSGNSKNVANCLSFAGLQGGDSSSSNNSNNKKDDPNYNPPINPSYSPSSNDYSSYRIDSNLMTKLAKKKYLQSEEEGGGNHNKLNSRPRGITSKIRVLVVDVPEFKYLFTGETCKKECDIIFPDGIITKSIKKKDASSSGSGGGSMNLEQLSFANSLYTLSWSLSQD